MGLGDGKRFIPFTESHTGPCLRKGPATMAPPTGEMGTVHPPGSLPRAELGLRVGGRMDWGWGVGSGEYSLRSASGHKASP